MRRAVFDTTILISAFLRPGGVSDELLTMAAEGHFALVLAPDIIAETWRKLLTSERLRARYRFSDERAHSFVRGLLRISEIMREVAPITGVLRDPNDDMIIACAVKASVSHIVTRDKDILSIGSYQKIAIVEPEQFRMHLRTETEGL
jgi:putative PIN family toxin of toxin-antitoxin system